MAHTGQLIPLSSNSDEYQRVTYLLQHWPHLVFSCHCVRPRTAQLSCLESFVDVNSLDNSNSLEEVRRRGFSFPEGGGGKSFSVGEVQVSASGNTHRYLLCAIGVGRPYAVSADALSARPQLPDGYDSFYVYKAGEDELDETQAAALDASSYEHEYIIPDSQQVLPRYLLQFTFNPATRVEATNRSANALAARRQRFREELNELKSRVGQALAVLGPSAGDETDRMLNDLASKYEDALAASHIADPVLEERKRAIHDTITALNDKMQKVQTNSKSIEELIYQKMEEVLFQLQDETDRKLSLLQSQKLELHRQLHQLERTESFVDVLQDHLPPVSFISAWQQHCAERNKLCTEDSSLHSSVQVLEYVQPDLEVVGSLEVVTSSAVPPQHLDGRSTALTPYDALPPPPPQTLPGTTPSYSQFRGTGHVMNQGHTMAASYGGPGPTGGPQASSGLANQIWTNALHAQYQTAHAPSMRSDASVTQESLVSYSALPSPAHANAPPAPLPQPTTSQAVSSASVPHKQKQEPAQLSKEALQAKLSRFSLSAQAMRTKRQRGSEITNPAMAFADSRIISGREAMTLYLCLPGTTTDSSVPIPPHVSLVYASYNNPAASVADFRSQCEHQIGPTVVLIKANDRVFGGFAAEAWDFTSSYTGSTKCFLFSITEDVKIPYTGRDPGPLTEEDQYLKKEHEAREEEMAQLSRSALSYRDPHTGEVTSPRTPQPRKRPFVPLRCLRSSTNTLQFGTKDLVISHDFSSCSSQIENCYGIGLPPQSDTAKTLLAGSETFAADVVEIWSVGSDLATSAEDLYGIASGAHGLLPEYMHQ